MKRLIDFLAGVVFAALLLLAHAITVDQAEREPVRELAPMPLTIANAKEGCAWDGDERYRLTYFKVCKFVMAHSVVFTRGY